MIKDKEILSRAYRLFGDEGMRRLDEARVIIFGVGGVGSWCAESLIRTGVRHLTIVDCDRVSVSNINRQLMATTLTVGEVKVDALKQRLLTILPDAEIEARRDIYTEETADSFNLDEYDYVIDAIDSLKDKVLLIQRATRSRARLFSSMGAALKLDPTRIQVAEFWEAKGCPLARALRQRFKKSGVFPAKKFKCVFSDELLSNRGELEEKREEREEREAVVEEASGVRNVEQASREMIARKAQINGSIMHITAIFGLTLAGLVIEDIIE